MGNHCSAMKKFRVFFVFIYFFAISSCCWFNPDSCENCFEDANLWFPPVVYNVEITRTNTPTFINGQYYPFGTVIGVGSGGAFNEFFSVVKYQPLVGQNVTYFWNRDTLPGFTNLENGEEITFYKTVVNTRQDNSIDCIFEEVEEVTSILDVRVRTNDTGEIIGTRQVEKTIFNIPSGKYGTFNFTFDFIACGNYELDIRIDPEGQLNETSVNDNNYSETQQNFGFCF